MPLTARARLGALLAGGVICAGCQGGATPAAKPYASQPAPAEAADPPLPSTASPRIGLPGPLEPNLERSNEDGVKVKVTRITFRPNEILVDLIATNASPNPVALAGSPFTGMTLVDDKGTSYDFQASKQNQALQVAPGHTYEGQVTFLGALVGDASSLTLTANAGSGGDRFVPRFEFANIPVAPS